MGVLACSILFPTGVAAYESSDSEVPQRIMASESREFLLTISSPSQTPVTGGSAVLCPDARRSRLPPLCVPPWFG